MQVHPVCAFTDLMLALQKVPRQLKVQQCCKNCTVHNGSAQASHKSEGMRLNDISSMRSNGTSSVSVLVAYRKSANTCCLVMICSEAAQSA
jgi:hypothetical protein